MRPSCFHLTYSTHWGPCALAVDLGCTCLLEDGTPESQVRLQAPARLNLHLATPFLTQACSFWKLGSQWDRDPMAMCPPSHLLTKMHALPGVTMSSL